MKSLSAEKNYTLEAISSIMKKWISEELFACWIVAFLQAEALIKQKLRKFYKRMLTPWVTLQLMLYQRLSADHSCDEAMSAFVSGLPAERQIEISESNSAYCQARKRLPLAVVKDSLRHVNDKLREQIGADGLWCGREPHFLDGSTIRLAAEEELEKHYGVSSNQHGKNHWPLMRLVAAFHLFTGALTEAIEGAYAVGEGTLVVDLMKQAAPGIVWVADRNFGTYRTVQVAVHQQQDVVLRMRQDRIQKWIGKQKMVSGEDRDVVWSGHNNKHVEDDLPTPDVPGRLIYLFVQQPGFRPKSIYIFTTLTDHELYPTDQILALYKRRWEVELDLRHLKTTMKMESLSAKSVEIVRKELWVGFLAYSLVRAVIGLAAVQAHLSPSALSFAQALRRILLFIPQLARARSPRRLDQLWDILLQRVAKCVLPIRKKLRFEPRQVWGKPRPFRTMKVSRDHARQQELAKLAPAIS